MNMNIIEMVQLANYLSASINECYSDINDIDFMMHDLRNKKKTLAKRMERSVKQLKAILNNDSFIEQVRAESIEELTEALEGTDDLIATIKSDLDDKV